jgi:hypothetical protein
LFSSIIGVLLLAELALEWIRETLPYLVVLIAAVN